jgi:hypothetical protein
VGAVIVSVGVLGASCGSTPSSEEPDAAPPVAKTGAAPAAEAGALPAAETGTSPAAGGQPAGAGGEPAAEDAVAPATAPPGAAATAPAQAQQAPVFFCWMDQDEDAGDAPLTVRFISQVEGGVPPYAVKWNFDDGSPPSSELNPVHTYAKPGRYLAELFATDSRGDKDDDFTIIEVW